MSEASPLGRRMPGIEKAKQDIFKNFSPAAQAEIEAVLSNLDSSSNDPVITGELALDLKRIAEAVPGSTAQKDLVEKFKAQYKETKEAYYKPEHEG